MIRDGILGLAIAALPMAVLAQSGAGAAGANVSMCVGCHGIRDYRTAYPSVYSVPMIAGQSPGYIESALVAYRKGDRDFPTMRAIASGLSDGQIADLAAYYGAKLAPERDMISLPLATGVSAAGLARGRRKVEQVCSACHGKDASTPIDPSYPKLAGQHADYLLHALAAYRSGARKNPVMGAQARLLTKDEMADVAAYLASLPGQLGYRN